MNPTPCHPETDLRPCTGAELIAAERARQIHEEGWTAKHDDQHANGELSAAGSIYAMAASYLIAGNSEDETWKELQEERLLRFWPWEPGWLKISPDPIRSLVKCGALAAAEIDRLLRLQNSSTPR